jgi:tetratricopeptide (TPR) repeat protein
MLWVLSDNDDRFRDAMDRRTIELFVVWFFFCIIATVAKFMPVANIAHGAGAILGILTGFAVSRTDRRRAAVAGLCAVLVFGGWGATVGRPKINLSKTAGYEEGQWGYQALLANRNQEAVKWFRDAVTYQPNDTVYWHDLGLAYQQTGNEPAAIAAYRRAADDGDIGDASYLGMLYDYGIEGVTKDEKQAVYWYRKAAAGNNPEALNNVAWAYATSHDPEVHNPTAALGCARKAVSLDHEPDPYHLDTLAEAYFANGKYEDAVRIERQAIALGPVRNKQETQENLEKYERALQNQTPQRNTH